MAKKYKVRSIALDADKLLDKLHELMEKSGYIGTFQEFCEEGGVTSQRVYTIRNSPNVTVRTANKFKKMGVIIDEVRA